ncbi:MAG: hypothetical protein K0S65_6610, partial [Labilithrix sp.]|nr:hypothetical protein [Labilithrix sp.]
MSTENESEAVLRLRVIDEATERVRSARAEWDNYNESVGFAEKESRSVARELGRVEDRLTKLTGAAKSAGDGLKRASQQAGSKEWNELAERIDAAQVAYRRYREEVALGTRADAGMDAWISQYNQHLGNGNLTRGDLQTYRAGSSGSLLGDDAAELRDTARATDDLTEAGRRLEIVQRQRAQQEAAEANRQMEIRAALAMRVKEEQDLAAAIARRAEQDSNSNRARAFQAENGVDTRLGQPSTGQRARNTGLAAMLIEEENKAERARRALAEHDEQLNRGTVAYRASTSALGQMLVAQEEHLNNLPRLRYAMYDIAFTAGLMGTAIAGTAVATLAASASMESA